MGEAIVQFIKSKPAPFPKAMSSQDDFLRYPSWQRGLIFMFLVRHVLELHATIQWKDYCPKELKLNMRLMHRYKQHDMDIITKSTTFQKLTKRSDNRSKAKRGRDRMSPSDTSDGLSSSSPAKV